MDQFKALLLARKTELELAIKQATAVIESSLEDIEHQKISTVLSNQRVRMYNLSFRESKF